MQISYNQMDLLYIERKVLMKKTSIGGSALLEGILMIGPEHAAIAVRKPDGEIVLERRNLPLKGKLSKVPILRGVVNFIKQMILSIKAMMFSAEFLEIEGEEGEKYQPSKFEQFLERKLGDKIKDVVIYFSLISGIALSVGLFIILPNVLADLIPINEDTYSGVVLLNLLEGIIKLVIFFLYLLLASMAKDIKRVWQYHGAEHKTINCYEAEEELTVENVAKFTTKNPRCGTSFLFFVILISIVVFSFLGWYGMWLNVLIRVALVPFVAGLSYEVFRFSGKSESFIAKIIRLPGLLFQYLTTKEPDNEMIEVAITAFKDVLVQKPEANEF